MTDDMTDDRPATELYDGCPNCKRPLHSEGNYVVCGNCGFKIAALYTVAWRYIHRRTP